jgi:single stranded DNA-binding protein
VWNTKSSQLADIVEKYVKKGDKLYVEGRIEYRQWQDKDGQTRYSTEINVRELIMLGGGSGGGVRGGELDSEAANGAAPRGSPAKAKAGGGDDFEDFPARSPTRTTTCRSDARSLHDERAALSRSAARSRLVTAAQLAGST